MARYYEETVLLEFVRRYTPHFNGETTIQCVERAIKEAPTADVAPRAEVEKIIEEVKKKAEAYFWHHDSVATSWFMEFCDELKKKYTNVPAKDYYTPEEVRDMSPSEVRQNIETIRKSMKKWR